MKHPIAKTGNAYLNKDCPVISQKPNPTVEHDAV
jgi:hypothetical protein